VDSEAYWCSTKVQGITGIHKAGNWGLCNSSCPKAETICKVGDGNGGNETQLLGSYTIKECLSSSCERKISYGKWGNNGSLLSK